MKNTYAFIKYVPVAIVMSVSHVSGFDVVGVDMDNRKNQQNVLDLLNQKPKWAGGLVPEVYVRNIAILDKELDVIIIKQVR